MDLYNFQTLLQVNPNKFLGYLDISEIAKLELHIPSIQRLEYKDKLAEIVNYQEEYFKKHKCFNFLGVINIHHCLFDNKMYIIDGQHRYKSIMELYHKNYRNESISIEIIKVNTLEELKENYEMLNKNTPLPEFEFGIPDDNIIHNEVLGHFVNRYKELFSTNTRVHRPNISRIKFEEALEYLRAKLKTTNAQTLIKQIEKENEHISNWNIENFPKLNTLTNPEKTITPCRTWKFYLGMFFFNGETYCYDWVKSIIKNETGEILEKDKGKGKNKKKTIPISIKKQLWDTYFGSNGTAKCICCHHNEIKMNDFHAGHYISESNGGEVKLDNLRPICKGCNLSMGTTNMDDYMTEYY